MEYNQFIVSRIMEIALETSRAYKPKVVSSNPISTTNKFNGTYLGPVPFCFIIEFTGNTRTILVTQGTGIWFSFNPS